MQQQQQKSFINTIQVQGEVKKKKRETTENEMTEII